jgi:hypothetical protein
MSVMSRAEAEAAGWVFVHAQEGSRTATPSFRAERWYSPPRRPGQLVSEEADSEELLLRRITGWERLHGREPLG